MAGIHAERFLPPRFKMIEEDIIGTHSGNPASNVVYGFKNNVLDGTPVFTVIEVVPEDSASSRDRRLRAFGAFKESDYNDVMHLLRDDRQTGWERMMDEYNTVHSGKVAVEITVPKLQTVEFIAAHALKIVSFEG